MNLVKFEENNYGKDVKILARGSYKGYEFLVIYTGSHPCAYIKGNYDLTEEQKWVNPAHYGITYKGNLAFWNCQKDERVKFTDEEREYLKHNFLGWDYGHFGDYESFFSDFPDFDEEMKKNPRNYIKWTTREILEDVKTVIEWIIKENL